MIWYRHWLELRYRLLLIVAVALAFGLFPAVTEFGATNLEGMGFLYTSSGIGDLLPVMGPARLFLWANYSQHLTEFMLASFLVAGIGFRGRYPSGALGAASALFTLSLPVSRGRIIWTRFVAGALAFATALALSLAMHWAILLKLGREVPFGPMAISTLFAMLAALPGLALIGMFIPLMNEVWAVFVTTPAVFIGFFLNIRWTWHTVTYFVAHQRLPWGSLLAIVASTAVLLSLTISFANEQEF